MKVSVERRIEQVVDGSHYKGHIKIADTKFDYDLKFAVPISRLDDTKPSADPKEIRRMFQLVLKRGEAIIDLMEDEYSFFFYMLVTFAVEFYNDPQTRHNNGGLIGMILSGQGPMADLGVSGSISIVSSTLYDFKAGLCEILNAPKFGCKLAS